MKRSAITGKYDYAINIAMAGTVKQKDCKNYRAERKKLVMRMKLESKGVYTVFTCPLRMVLWRRRMAFPRRFLRCGRFWLLLSACSFRRQELQEHERPSFPRAPFQTQRGGCPTRKFWQCR